MRKYEINGNVQGGFYMEMIFMIYMAWAVYSGYKVMSGRSEWLDKRAPVNMIVKFIVGIIKITCQQSKGIQKSSL